MLVARHGTLGTLGAETGAHVGILRVLGFASASAPQSHHINLDEIKWVSSPLTP